MSGSTTPTSAGSYSDAQVREQSVWQAEASKLKVAQLDELLRRKGIKPKGVKAEKAMEVAWHTWEAVSRDRGAHDSLTPLDFDES